MITELSQSDLDYIQTVLDSGQNLYRAYDRISEVAGSSLSSDQSFWFEQASIINQQANGISPDPDNNQSAIFILSYTDYGLAVDRNSADLQITSNAIAQNVLQDVLAEGGVSQLDDMLSRDIYAAISPDVGGQTIGGWGGSFFYWGLEYRIDQTTGQPVTVGADILSNAADLEKFINASVFATMATASQNALDGGQTLSEYWEQFSAAFLADAPFSIKYEIQRRLLEAEADGNISTSTYFTSEDGTEWIYSEEDGEFHRAGLTADEIATGETETYLRERLEARNQLEADGLGGIAQAFISIGRADLIPEPFQCFGPEASISMWPLDPEFAPDPNNPFKQYDQYAVRAKIWKKPIELIRVGDYVVSHDKDGNMVPGYVPRTMSNKAKILLNFHGTPVTPGHVYYRPDSKRSDKYETLIDVLRDDGMIEGRDGVKLRAATYAPVDGPLDKFVKAVTGTLRPGGGVDIKEQGRIRLGTRFIVRNDKGRKDYSVADLIEAGGGVVGDDELIRVGDGPGIPFHWDFGDTLPKPEDFVLAASGTTLEDIYKAAEWESQGPRLPAPMVLDRGLVQPLSYEELSLMPRNTPLDIAHHASTKTQAFATTEQQQEGFKRPITAKFRAKARH